MHRARLHLLYRVEAQSNPERADGDEALGGEEIGHEVVIAGASQTSDTGY